MRGQSASRAHHRVYGPTIATLDAMGAKNDVLLKLARTVVAHRVVQLVHAGVLHLAFNMMAVWRIGFDLERVLARCALVRCTSSPAFSAL